MTNKEVIDAFTRGIASAESTNMYTDCTGNKLFSYRTCIAQRVGGKIIVNATRYSNTTSKHQFHVRRAVGAFTPTAKEVDYDETDLRKYV